MFYDIVLRVGFAELLDIKYSRNLKKKKTPLYIYEIKRACDSKLCSNV
jgi:hypothetical protein